LTSRQRTSRPVSTATFTAFGGGDPMLHEKIQAALNKQLNAELYSSYLYLSMSAYFQSINLPGFATWMRVQAQEELVHAMKFYDFVNERGGRVALQPVEGPPTEWSSPLVAPRCVRERVQARAEGNGPDKRPGQPGPRRTRPRHQHLPPVVCHGAGGRGGVRGRGGAEAQAHGR
jgi:hypothetical protein